MDFWNAHVDRLSQLEKLDKLDDIKKFIVVVESKLVNWLEQHQRSSVVVVVERMILHKVQARAQASLCMAGSAILNITSSGLCGKR